MDEKIKRLIDEAFRAQTWEEMMNESRQGVRLLVILTTIMFLTIIVMASRA